MKYLFLTPREFMRIFVKNRFWLLVLSIAWISTPLMAQNTNIIRAAIDIGSGGPKLRVAEVDLTTNKIVKILYVKQYPVIFQEDLSRSGDSTLSPGIMSKGLNAIKDAIVLAKSYKTEGIVIIGTSVFRNAINGESFANTIHQETGLQVHILDQKLEGKLAFHAVLARMDVNTENLVVWDIGGGSTQFIGTALDGSYLIDGSNEGSGPFRDFIIESIQGRNIKEYRSPNPISHKHADLAEAHAYALSAKVDQIFKNKFRNSATEIVGVGSVFGRGIISLMGGKNSFTIEEFTTVVNTLIGKTDEDLGGGDFACIEVSNALLTLGLMKGLNISQMRILDANNTEGAMVYKFFWE